MSPVKVEVTPSSGEHYSFTVREGETRPIELSDFGAPFVFIIGTRVGGEFHKGSTTRFITTGLSRETDQYDWTGIDGTHYHVTGT